MAFQWMRRVLLVLAPAALLALAACGSGTIESQFHPTRMVVFGDAFADIGQTPGARYTVNNDEAAWPQSIAGSYGLSPLTASSAGGTDYATGNARIALKPDAAGSTATRTVTEQIDAFLATGSLGANDLVILQGGISDTIVQMRAVIAGSQTRDQMLANLRQAGVDLAAQARRLKAAGASHIAIIGSYDLSTTPWGISTGQQSLLADASKEFNNAVLVALVNEGEDMLYIDTPLLFNLIVNNPGSYALVNVTTPACTSVDAGPGIGIGAGQVNSALCKPTTIAAGVDPATYMWADAVYPTPTIHARFATFAYTRIHDRW